MAIIKVNLGRIVPTPSGIVDQRFIDGDDGTVAPTAPEIGVLIAVNSTTVDIPVTSAGTQGTNPVHWELERSATSAIAGFSVVDAAADFTGDGVITNASLTASTTYWYRLARVDAIGRRSAYSTVRQVTTPAAGGAAPGAPTITSLTSPGAGQVVVNFTAGTGTNTGFDVLFGIGDGAGNPIGEGSVIASNIPSSPFNDSGRSGQVYYRVRGLNGAIAGPYSARSFITPTTGGSEFAGVVRSNFETDTIDGLVGHTSVDANWGWNGSIADSDQGFVRSSATLARSGSRYLESTINRDEAGGGTNERNEIKWQTPTQFPTTLTSTPAGNILVMTQDVWLGFSVFVPASWRVLWKRSNGVPLFTEAAKGLPIVCQIHTNKDTGTNAGDEGNPPISIGIGADNATSPSALPAWRSNISRNQSYPTLSSNTSDQTNVGALVRLGEWTDFVMRIREHPFSGYCYIYKKDSSNADFVLHASRTGGVGYSKPDKAPYWKIGGYYSLWNMATYPTRLTVDTNNNEVRSIQLRFDETRYYYGDDGSIAHVRPR